MALDVVWTQQAIAGYENVISYLNEHWTDREIGNFIRTSNSLIIKISNYPELLEQTNRHKMVRRGPLDNHNVITYRVNRDRNRIEILNIRSAKQKPLKN